MPVTKYQYTISTQTANGKVYIPALSGEIDGNVAIAIAVDYMNVNIEPDKLDVYMADALTAPQEAALTATVAATQGYGINAVMKGSVQLTRGEDQIVSDVPWQVVEGVVTTPSFFDPNMAQIIARIIGEHKGAGGQLRLVEEMIGEPDEEKIVPVFDFPDTGGLWQRFSVDSNIPPRDGTANIYRTDCRLNGAADLELRYATISMIVVKIV